MILINTNGTDGNSLSFCAVFFNVGVGGCSNGGGCDGLHICVMLLVGKCSEGFWNCKMGHQLKSEHNKLVISKAGVSCLSLETLFDLVVYCAKKRGELNF